MQSIVDEPAWIRVPLQLMPIVGAPWQGQERGVAAPAVVVIPWHWALSHMRPSASVPIATRERIRDQEVQGASIWSDGGCITTADLSRQVWPDELQ